MKHSISSLLGLSLLLTGCAENATTATQNPPATNAQGSSYKLTGNRSADPLGNYGPSTPTGTYTDPSNVAGHAGSETFPTTNTVRGGR